MASHRISPLHIVSRIGASLAGGYAFTWGFVALGAALLLTAGVGFEEAQQTTALLAFIVFLIVFCWAFTAASLARVWGVLAGGGLLMTGSAWLLLRALT